MTRRRSSKSPAVTGKCACQAHWSQLTLLHVLRSNHPLCTHRERGCGKCSLERCSPSKMTSTSSPTSLHQHLEISHRVKVDESKKAQLFAEPNEEIAKYPRASFDLWFPYSGNRLLNDLLKFIPFIEKLWQKQCYKTASSPLDCRRLFCSQVFRLSGENKVNPACKWKGQLNFKISWLCQVAINACKLVAVFLAFVFPNKGPAAVPTSLSHSLHAKRRARGIYSGWEHCCRQQLGASPLNSSLCYQQPYTVSPNHSVYNRHVTGQLTSSRLLLAQFSPGQVMKPLQLTRNAYCPRAWWLWRQSHRIWPVVPRTPDLTMSSGKTAEEAFNPNLIVVTILLSEEVLRWYRRRAKQRKLKWMLRTAGWVLPAVLRKGCLLLR